MDRFASLFMVSPLLLGVFSFVAMLADFINSLAGGDGLFTIPALMVAGIPPARALATNKLQACGGSISSSLYLIRRDIVNLADQKLNIFMTFIGPMNGALSAQHVQSGVLCQTLPVLAIRIGLCFLLMPKIGEEDRQCRLCDLPFMLATRGCVGFCDGFFGPAAGSFHTLASVMLCGYNLAGSTAYTKILNATSDIGGSLLFAPGDKMIWATDSVTLVSWFIDTRMGSRLVLDKGQKFIWPMTVIVSAVMSTKLLYDNHGQEILHWLGMN